MGIPRLQKSQTVLDHKCAQSVHLMRAESAGFRQSHRIKPELRDPFTLLDMDVGRLSPFHTVEEKSKAGNA
jgi:hypothetical protein